MRPKRPAEKGAIPGYPEHREAQIHRRRFMAILGGGAAAAALLPSCGGRTAGKVIAVPPGEDGPDTSPEDVQTAANATDPEPPTSPPGMPPRPARGEVVRLPAQGALVCGAEASAVSYAVWVEYMDEPAGAMREFVSGAMGEIEQAFSLIVSRLGRDGSLSASNGPAMASDMLRERFEEMYTGATGSSPVIHRLWIDILRMEEKMPVPGGMVAPQNPEPPPPLPGVPPRPRPMGKMAPSLPRPHEKAIK